MTYDPRSQMFARNILSSKGLGTPVLHTLHLRYPRIIHAELMTHRKFCLAGDAMLDFDLPAGSRGRRRVHSMSLREFADKWLNGAAEGASSRHNGCSLNHLEAARYYSAKEVAAELGMRSASNLNALCRDKTIFGAVKRGREWVAYGRYWMDWRESTGTRRFDIRPRLDVMRIRQIDELTGQVVTSTVRDCIASGNKEVFRVSAGSFSVCGSKDHRVLTETGWKRIEELVVGVDRIITYRYGEGAHANPNRHNKIDGRWVQTWSRQNRDFVAKRQSGLCAQSGEPLQPSFHLHHIEPRHLRPDLAFDLNNVIAVNPDAHTVLHETQGWQVGVPLGSVGTLVDSVVSEGVCDTYDLEIAGEFPNFFADGVVVHNSRNARSSRAVPVQTMIDEVRETPFIPWHWGKNQKGMQAGEECNEPVLIPDWDDIDFHGKPHLRSHTREEAWLHTRDKAVDVATSLMKAGYHKQLVNRLLEPFMWIDVLVSSTDWDNFLWLRDHKDAEPHIRDLAVLVREALDTALVQELKEGEWHLPYITKEDREAAARSREADNLGRDKWLCKVSAARCARISYAPFDGDASYERELERYNQLVTSDRVHASPTEHQAQVDHFNREYQVWVEEFLSGNFAPGWIQHRKLIPNEAHYD